MNFSSWYEKVYPSLSGYGLWLRGGEPNTLRIGAFETSPLRVLITRLSTYRDTADSFTHKLLYQIVTVIPGAYPDTAYLPPPRDAEVFDRDRVPWLLGTTSKRTARDFNIIALSLSIVQELLNIAPMLRKSDIPLSGRERMADAACPLIILGGAGALHSSFLPGEDPCVDGIFVGEDAGTILRLFSVCKDGFAENRDKCAILDDLRSIPGFFRADGPVATTVFHAPLLPAGQLLERGPILYDEENIGTASLQISEGCAYSCSFCAESFGRKPYREFDVALLRDAALRLKAGMAVEKLELYSFNFSMHQWFHRLLAELAPLFPTIGLKSQRLDSIAKDPDILKFLHAVGKTNLTCGIEGISSRLRGYLHKSLGEPELRQGLVALLTAPIRELKIFLIATGIEKQADYNEFRSLLAFMRGILQSAKRQPRIIFSMTILVRFPWTPLEFEDAPKVGTCRAVLLTTERLVRAAGFEFRASNEPSEYWLSQLLVRIADPRVAAAVRAACDTTGFVYYREIPTAFVSSIRQQLTERGIAVETPFKGYTPETRRKKPWSGITIGVSEKYLATQWKSAKRWESRGYSEEPMVGERTSAGEAIHQSSALHEDFHLSIEQFRKLLAATHARETTVDFRVLVSAALAGVPVAMRGTLLAKALLIADPSLVPVYWGNRGSRIAGIMGWERVTGDDIVSLGWLRPADETIRQRLGDPAFIQTVDALLDETLTLIGIAELKTDNAVKVVFRSPFPFDPAEYFALKSLKYTLCKTGPTTTDCRLSSKSLRKKIISWCSVECVHGITSHVTIIPGLKFSPGEFARKAFRLPEKNDWVRIEMVGKFPK
jgi:hypothetical protein